MPSHIVASDVVPKIPQHPIIHTDPTQDNGREAWRGDEGSEWVAFSDVWLLGGFGWTRRVDAVTLTCARLMAHIGHIATLTI